MALPVHQQAKYWGIAAAVFLAVLWVLGDVILPFVVGGAIAYFLDPLADRLERAGLGRVGATTLIALLLALIFVLVVLALVLAADRPLPALLDRQVGPVALRFLEIMAGGKMRAFRTQDDHPDLRILLRALHRLVQLFQQLPALGVAMLRPVQGNAANPAFR